MKTDYITNLETLRGAMRESSMLTALAMLAITGDQKEFDERFMVAEFQSA